MFPEHLGRDQDTVGIACGYLFGAEQTGDSLSSTTVFETYARFVLNDYFAITADVQYMNDTYVPTASQNDLSGWIVGVRMTALF